MLRRSDISIIDAPYTYTLGKIFLNGTGLLNILYRLLLAFNFEINVDAMF